MLQTVIILIGPRIFHNIDLSVGLREEFLKKEQFTSKNLTIAEKRLTPPRAVQIVRVTGDGLFALIKLCEIMIYRQADCQPGRYGVNYSKQCYCLVGPCDSVTDACRSIAEVSISTTECPDCHSDKYYNALLAVSIVLGVVVAAVAVLIVVFSTRKHRQCVGGTRANSESTHQNMYDDLGQRSTNPDHYDSFKCQPLDNKGANKM